VLAESIEARLAMGETVDLAEHCTISSTLVRLATRLGINRHARVITPLRDYLEAKAGAPAAAGAAP
jgi:DNA-binding MurR/RpiR family transcriptional regulator